MNREPVGNTCGDIDSILNVIRSIEKLCALNGNEKANDLSSIIEDVEFELRGCDSMMEDLRSANSMLREWGNNEAQEVDRLEDELYGANRKIVELEQRI